ncbi:MULTISPECIES: malectin domain-containing carbohydrate-binding protein [Emticicia]|uniref:malectin domain-containing carbohydrate-binding protein n=1 Tax=Emticicia TaxID=312278 RepID=UPI0007D8A254|nr:MULTISPECIES: malectin domain-containing carbohydrate-binding protein [Emticicia]
MKKTIAVWIGILFYTISSVNAQSCNCSRTISASGIYNGQTMNVKPGEVICVQAGNYSLLRFVNFIGTASQPIIIKNCGGQVTIAHNQYYGALDFLGSKYFKVTGSGSTDIQYGFLIAGTGATASGLSIAGLSTNCEVERVEVKNTGFAGMLIKTDPNCDPSTWRSSFTMTDVSIHDNYVHDTGGEGLYIGNSFYNVEVITCSGQKRTVFPHLIEKLKIYNNTVVNTGADGIQYACAPDAEVYNNSVSNYGISPFEAFQNNGMQLGSVSGKFYGNKIKSGNGNGIQIVQPLGNLSVYNNIVESVGQNALFSDDRFSTNNLLIANNTFVKSGQDLMKIYGSTTSKRIYNNILAESSINSYIVYGLGAAADEKNNLKVNSATSVGFLSDKDFHLTINSPAINAGINPDFISLSTDIEGNKRPNGGFYDLGAYESMVNPPIFTPIGDKNLSASSSLKFNISASDPDGGVPKLAALNIPTYANFKDNGNGTGTFSATPQSSNMTFNVTFAASDTTGGVTNRTIQVRLYASIPTGQQTMYRVNAGGPAIGDSNGILTEDSNANPSPYTNVTAAGSTTSTSSVTTNKTSLPNQVFQTFRRDSQTGDDMRWNFPVYYDASWYILNLYFIESISSANRVFNILVEGNNVAPGFDIKALVGTKVAMKKSYYVYVSDGTLNIQFQRILDNPLVSAIEVISLGTSTPPNIRQDEPHDDNLPTYYEIVTNSHPNDHDIDLNANPLGIVAFPNPVQDILYLITSSTDPLKVTLINISGNVLWEGILNDENAQNSIPFGKYGAGIYEIIVTNDHKQWVGKIVKF